MADKFFIVHGLNEFNAAPYGVLTYKDGRIDALDEEKAFNRERRMRNAGSNVGRILRSCPVEWEAPIRFDWKNEAYFPLLKRYCAIKHQPHQLAKDPAPGAIVVIDPINGCDDDDKAWIYARYEEVRALYRQFFIEFKNVPYVRISAGNETNSPLNLALKREVIFPEFKRAGLHPFHYGAIYSMKENLQEEEKGEYEKQTSFDGMKIPFRHVHGITDEKSEMLREMVKWFVADVHGVRAWGSVDGAMNGESPDDFAVNINTGKVQRRPSLQQLDRALAFLFADMPAPLTKSGEPKFAFEWISKAVNRDDLAAAAIERISMAYKKRFGAWPANYGKYLEDWKDPAKPEPRPPVILDEKPKGKSWLEKYWPWIAAAAGAMLTAFAIWRVL